VINNGWQNPALDFLMPVFTRMGEIWLMVLIVVPVLYRHDKKNFYKYLLLFAGGLILTGVVGRILKMLIDRPRPLKEMALLIQSHQVYIHVIGKSLREYSFPSGHTFSAFSGATFLSLLFRRWSPLFFAIALMTGLSRIYVGAHFPTDVLAGMVIGTGTTLFFCLLVDKVWFNLLIKSSVPAPNKGN
jgi:undecaprenyl-diphosphatase